ncbi:MAG: DUF4157 domain-containing protein [Cellvibrio sp.]|uniref:eCIS core domain-containing protein n=1 Tax=Cellvibrio sp. TaxID=1965322 RepID=UPI00272477B8|nr:DUF4157 domain-containing protein [Cellvibrio sp.]
MVYVPQSKESSNPQHKQEPTKAIAQTFSDNRESVAASLSLQAMMTNSPQQQKLKATAQMMANSPAQQRLNTTAPTFANKPEPLQRMENEESLQGKFETESDPAQLEVAAETPRLNNTGLPDNLKAGIENLSGMSMDHVKVHYNSDKPAQLQAHAYAQGSEIHVAPGQEQHLPHEAWHVVQQAQGRVRPTVQMKGGVEVNDDMGLESEADLMGGRVVQMFVERQNVRLEPAFPERQNTRPDSVSVVQRMVLPVWANDKDKSTFLDQGEQQSKAMGHGKVINIGNYFTDKNLSGIGEYEDLHIIGHGNPVTVAGMTPDILANWISITLNLPIRYKGRIFLETCESGTQIEQLGGTYAERFIIELNKLRGKDAEQLTAIGFSGSVVLDTAYSKKETIRVLKNNISIEEFKARAPILIEDTSKIVDHFLETLRGKDLGHFIESQDIQNLHFHIYNTKISEIAEPQGGRLTRLFAGGAEYASIPDQIPKISKMMESIESAAQAQKNEIDSIPVLRFEDL